MGTIEDGNFASGWSLGFNPPNKVVSEFLRSWLFEIRDATAIGIQGADDVFDDAIFTSGVECLKTDEQGTFAFGEEALLEVIQLVAEVL